MSDHRGHIFLGFMATGPAIGIPENVWKWICCPKPKTDKYGRPQVAPYGLRKIEAALQEAGFKAAVIDPDYVDMYLDTAKALLIGHHDYFAMGPPSNEWWMLLGKEPVNRRSFIQFISRPEIWRAKERGLKIIVGGPAVWQWEVWGEARRRWPVDTLVEGEAEKVVVELARMVLEGSPLPEKVTVPLGKEPGIDEIPDIKAPSVCGLVEIMRGCPRGCRFCSVTLRRLRYMPLEKIEREIQVNINGGVRNVLLHSEDVLLYGADGVRPRAEPLLKLHRLAAKYLEAYGAGFSWSHASLAAVRYAEEHGHIVSRISEMVIDGDRRRFFGVEVGIETGSVRLARIHMPAKAAPYRVEEYPDTVEKAFSIMAENSIIPAATFILGLPGETEDDVLRTIELLERLRPYPSLIVPMFFVPMGMLKDMDGFKKEHLKPYHLEAFRVSAEHSFYWAKRILEKGYLRGPQYAPVRAAIRKFIDYAERRVLEYFRKLEALGPVRGG
ncbi:MAG: B12-binding domain-containing radical SAM protein [Desulfurococcales archaeon]|nr:B12-binding domain-containing radical SAM protein [Desulfurococcales archaeon]